MNRGYVKLYRKSLDNDLIRNPEAWRFMCWCLLKATHKPHARIVGTTVVELRPGQFIFGRAAAARELNSTERKIRTCLELLKRTGFLSVSATNKFSVVSITNWGIYQEDRQSDDRPDGREPTGARPTGGHKQECRTHKAQKEPSPEAPEGPANALPPGFCRFWEKYPKKTGKKAAARAWTKARDKPDLSDLLDALEKQKKWPQWLREGGRYIPNPATWINQGRWNDEPPEACDRSLSDAGLRCGDPLNETGSVFYRDKNTMSPYGTFWEGQLKDGYATPEEVAAKGYDIDDARKIYRTGKGSQGRSRSETSHGNPGPDMVGSLRRGSGRAAPVLDTAAAS